VGITEVTAQGFIPPADRNALTIGKQGSQSQLIVRTVTDSPS